MVTQPPEQPVEKAHQGDPTNANNINPPPKAEPASSEAKVLSSTKSFDKDFVIISEFSEIIGPVPLFVIPEWEAAGTFNLNKFVLKIMAVDTQNKSNDPQGYLKDTQVAMPESKEGAYTYLQHFTLLDVYARGYVRPMCISYITHDREKIMDYFHEMMNKVSKITQTLKEGNHRLFLRDLEDRMADVRHTQEVINNSKDATQTPTAANVNEYLADLEVMHQKFRQALMVKQRRTTEGVNAGLRHEDEHTTEEDIEGDNEMDAEGRGRENTGGKSIHKSVAEVVTRDYQPQLIQSLHPRTLHGKTLRDIYGLCDGTANKAMSLIKALHKHYSRPSVVLALDAFDAPSLLPSTSLLTIGQSVMLNFNLDMDKYMNQVINYEAERALSMSSFPTMSTNTGLSTTSSVDDDSSGYESPYSSSVASSPVQDDGHYMNEVSRLVNELSASGACDFSPHILLTPTEHEEAPSQGSPTGEEKTSTKYKQQPTINFFSANLWPVAPTYPGKGLMELRLKYPWLRHLVYSILRGRPVVVIGPATLENNVRGVVQALSILVPGLNSGISQWRTKALRMSDLASFKLTGLLKVNSPPIIPKAVEKYVTIFDIENESLKSPPYPPTGKYIEELFASKKQWPDELTYLAHVHYVLFEIGVKACMYYHICCVTVHQLSALQASQAYNYATQQPSPSSHNSHPPSHVTLRTATQTPSHGYPHTSPTSHMHHTHSHHAPQSTQSLRPHSPHAQLHARQPLSHLGVVQPPSPRHSQPPSPYVGPSPHPLPQSTPQSTPQPTSQPASPYSSQPPSPNTPIAHRPYPLALPSLSPRLTSSDPVLPVTPISDTTRLEFRLDQTQEIPLMKTPSADSIPRTVQTEPRFEIRTNISKTEPNTSTRRKGSVTALQALRSISMSSIEKYNKPANPNNSNSNISSTNNYLNTNNNLNSNTNTPTSSVGSQRVPDDWKNVSSSSPSLTRRNSSSPSSSSKKHSSWNYGGKLGVQSHRSFSDSLINPTWLPPNAATREQTRSSFFKQMEIPPGDSDIVMYLAEVVKEQQASEVQGSETPVIRLDYSSCQLFHSKMPNQGTTRR